MHFSCSQERQKLDRLLQNNFSAHHLLRLCSTNLELISKWLKRMCPPPHPTPTLFFLCCWHHMLCVVEMADWTNNGQSVCRDHGGWNAERDGSWISSSMQMLNYMLNRALLWQQEGYTLHEFSFTLMGLMGPWRSAPPLTFVEHILKQWVRGQPQRSSPRSQRI